LHNSGPSTNLTSYHSDFPGYRGGNQYIKPTNIHTRGNIPFRSKSTYANSYTKRSFKKDNFKCYPDQIKKGNGWFGKTTYGNFFSDPNP
jgi:hypothetical protein